MSVFGESHTFFLWGIFQVSWRARISGQGVRKLPQSCGVAKYCPTRFEDPTRALYAHDLPHKTYTLRTHTHTHTHRQTDIHTHGDEYFILAV